VARSVFLLADGAALEWMARIEREDPEATVLWFNSQKLPSPDTELSLIVEHESMERLSSTLLALAKRGTTQVYIDQHIRSIRTLVPLLEREGIAVQPIARHFA
jgi:hypothetical protein